MQVEPRDRLVRHDAGVEITMDYADSRNRGTVGSEEVTRHNPVLGIISRGLLKSSEPTKSVARRRRAERALQQTEIELSRAGPESRHGKSRALRRTASCKRQL